MIGQELAFKAVGWRRWLYNAVGILDVDEWIWYWHYRKVFLPYLRSLDSARILDAGCGRGLWSFYLARRFPSFQIVGIDVSDEMISFCQSIKHAKSADNVQFATAAFTDLTFRNEFDAVLCFNALHYSYKQDVEILRRFDNALKPGGVLMLAVPVAWPLRKGNLKNWALDDAQMDLYGITVDPKEFHDHYYPDELDEKLSMSGFDLLDIRRVIGTAGQVAKRVYSSVATRGLAKAAVWPFTFVLGRLDSSLKIRNGSFLLVLAKTRK